jgi:ArsR family transcriptional regulator
LRFGGASSILKSMVIDLRPITCCGPLAAPTLSDDETQATATLFKALGDPARVRIVNLLARAEEPVCLCELIEPVGLAQATISHHLRKLTDAGLLDREERGKWAYFSINADAMTRLASLIDLNGGSC